MKRFAELCGILETTGKTREKVAALRRYFQNASPEDAIWAIRLLLGWRPSRIVTSHTLQQWAHDLIDIPEWLFEESCKVVGDLLETLALICPLPERSTDFPLHVWLTERLLPLREKSEAEQKTTVIAVWQQMDSQQRFVWNKLLTGSFRPHVSERTLVKALSLWRGLPKTVLACRLKDEWPPTVVGYRELFSYDFESLDSSQPYSFHQTTLLGQDVNRLGNINDWLVGWHRKGERAQLIKRQRTVFIWSEDQVLLNETFPEVCDAAMRFPDGTVMDGVIMAWSGDAPMNVTDLERRMKRKRVTRQLLQEIPVRYWVDDLLEEHGQDVRAQALSGRYTCLRKLFGEIQGTSIRLSTPVEVTSWEALRILRNQARHHGADGLLLRRMSSFYCAEQMQEHWQIWHADPFTIQAVLLYVQRLYAPLGQRALEGTFGVWNGEQLVPVAKANSGFSEEDMYEIELFAKDHTIDRFGPVRSLPPELVFTVAFDDVYSSSRHKSGLIVQNPRVVCCQHEYAAQDADTVETIQHYLDNVT